MSRIIILISGNGSNLQAVLDATQDGSIAGVEVALVVSNRAAAFGLERAKAAGIPTLYFPLKPYTDAGKGRQSYDADLAQKLLPYEPDLIVAAGWMHIFSTRFLDHFPDKVINLHPAPPGQHAGVDGIKRTFEAYRSGDATHGGCMVHWVVPELDAGPVIAQTIVPIGEDDTLESFEKRLHNAEHRLIVKAIKKVLEKDALPPPSEVPLLN
jgi:formyltetrahydrofolate-dependent phosphoribosylglycinamide formyltransferase